MRSTAMPRALWLRAPLVLLRHPPVFVAVLAASFLVAMAAASAPLLRAGAESEALKGKLAELTPLGAGLTIVTGEAPEADRARADSVRRALAMRLAASIPYLAPPVLATTGDAAFPSDGNPIEVIPMARTGATEHVLRLRGTGDGAWLASRVAKLLHKRPGDTIQLLDSPKRVRLGAVYVQLDEDLDNPYWVNYFQRIHQRHPDDPARPSFLLVSRAEVYRISNGPLQNTFEFPVDPSAMTPPRAKELARRFAEVRSQLRGNALFHCPCSVTSPIEAATRLAAESVGALTPVISLLAGFAALVAIGAAFVAGTFGVRRREGEARLSVGRGELRAAFAARAALEALLPAVVGAALGLGFAALLIRLFTPEGTIDHGVARAAVAAALLATLGALLAVAVGAAVARGPLVQRDAEQRPWQRLPWEIVPLAVGVALLVAVERGHGLTRNAAVGAHPRLVVLCLPLLVAAPVAGLLVRGLRPLLRRARPRTDPVFLAVRRLAAARSMLVLLAVTAAMAVAATTFAEVLDRTLHASSTEKAYVANGSDVQAIVDATGPLAHPLPFPATRVTEDFDSARIEGDDQSLELMAVRPDALSRVIGHTAALRKLAASDATLPALAISSTRDARAIVFGGKRIPLDVVATVRSFPGMIRGEQLLVVPAPKLERLVSQPYESATAYLWVRGDPHAITHALTRAEPPPSYVTTVQHFLNNAELTTAGRAYGYLRVIALGSLLVALVALLLYLHARARTQLVTSELLDRMGMHAGRRALAYAFESASLVLFAGFAGVLSALIAARPIVSRLDPLPQYAPDVAVVVPWLAIGISLAALVLVAAVAGAVASFARGDLGEAVRVA